LGDLVDRLREHVGVAGPVQRARHPITPTAIADWCDAMGDTNPLYVDPDAAAKGRWGGLVAPPATLDIWDRPGVTGQPEFRPADKPAAADPRSKVLRLLDDAGYAGVVAVNSELEIARYLRPGELLQNTQLLEDVSEEKQTGLGIGHFVTTRQRYETADGERVGDLLFRILKFRPGTGRTVAADPAAPTGPSTDPALRPKPAVNRDNAFLFEGYAKRELRVSRCNGCGRVYFPPAPRCNVCGSFDQGYVVLAGHGTVYSHVTVHQPRVDGFRYPLPVALVETAEGPRVIGDVVGVAGDRVHVGMAVEVDWLSAGGGTLPRWRPATPSPRTATLSAAEVSAGAELPVWVLPVTATRITAGAIATRDFQDVHHDRELAVQKGSADIFFNINTSVGLLQRYVTDWSGPEVFVSALRVRLGAPAYPHSHLTFTGSVQSVDGPRVVVAVEARNDLGAHLTGTVELELASD
jgi:uncharacterized OB-fold protein